jgi:hypothetical protein
MARVAPATVAARSSDCPKPHTALCRAISGKEKVRTVKKLYTETVNIEVPSNNDYVDLGEGCYCGAEVEYVGNVSDAKLCFHLQVDVNKLLIHKTVLKPV